MVIMYCFEITVFSKDKKLMMDVYHRYIHTRHYADMSRKPSIGKVLDPYEVFWSLFNGGYLEDGFW